MRALFSCAVLAASMGFVATTEAFVVSSSAGVRCRSQRRQQTQEVAAETKATETKKNWDGNSWPAENERRKAVPADTKDWEMENTHVVVWEDRPNPTADLTWWENYAPSKEEIDAAAQGFNWSEEWFESAETEDSPATSDATEE